jgi:hypothetical protein
VQELRHEGVNGAQTHKSSADHKRTAPWRLSGCGTDDDVDAAATRSFTKTVVP